MELPIPTVQVRFPHGWRMEMFFVISGTLARAERMVGRAVGEGMAERTRNVADWVRGASTGCGSMAWPDI